jgi:sulfite reductase (NADPH) flavoprotein alpha-component
MVRFSPAQLDADALISLLRPLTPRLYSIASSQAKWRAKCMSPWAWCVDIEGRARTGEHQASWLTV